MTTPLRHTLRHLSIAFALLVSGCSDAAGESAPDAGFAESSIQLEIAPTGASVRVGGTVTFVVSRRTSTGLYPAPEASISSSDEAIATIDASTRVATGRAPGRVTFSAQWGPGRASVVLEVLP